MSLRWNVVYLYSKFIFGFFCHILSLFKIFILGESEKKQHISYPILFPE